MIGEAGIGKSGNVNVGINESQLGDNFTRIDFGEEPGKFPSATNLFYMILTQDSRYVDGFPVSNGFLSRNMSR